MKIYGYALEHTERVALSEASIVASAGELRALAAFFNHVADRKEGVVENTSDHVHFRDHWPSWESESADVVLMTVDTQTSS
ncbi:Imm32 family immunity protein [Pseudomonas phoenicis]|uniref:Imm32 family immunity protein n=1 Tax=unclassified Pseudomonas TaxID=196821 RepID=UPI0039A13EC7